MTAATFGRSTSPVDSSKLVHHVKKLLQQTMTTNNNNGLAMNGQRTNKTTADEMVRLLRSHHREYLRKDVVRLRVQVEQVLEQQQQQQQQVTPSKMPAKRKRSQKERRKETADHSSTVAAAIAGDDTASEKADETTNRNKKNEEDDNELEYDTAAKEHDWLRERIQHVGGGLNATLCQRYKKVAQAQAEAAAAAAAAAALEEEAEGSANSTIEGEAGLALNASQAAVTDGTPSTPNTSSGTVAAAAMLRRDEDGATTVTATTKKRKTGTKTNSNKRRIRNGPFARSANGINSNSAGPFDDAAFAQSSPLDFLSPVPRPKERYTDLGGMDAVITQIRQLVEYPLLRPELYRHLGVEPPRGVLLRGPPGVGKTHLSHAVAGQLGDVVAYFCVSAPELVSGMSGESEGRIRNLFQAASDHAPSIIFLDELDAIAPKRGNDSNSSRGMEKRMVAQLLTCMDMIAPPNNRNQAAVIVLAATNRPDALDAALRRAGRFDKEILLGVPDEDAREHILRAMTKDMRLDGEFDYKALARRTPGYVGADVRSLAKEAAVLAINRIFHNVLENGDAIRSTKTTTEQDDGEEGDNGANSSASAVSAVSNEEDTLSVPAPTKALATNAMPLPALTPEQMEPLYITMDDFLNALPLVQPSSKREGFATVPDVCWDDIGALESIREELTISVLEPIKFPEKFKALGLSLPAGVLLYGPPGCGKVRAQAKRMLCCRVFFECHANL